jgi:opacity protein-like surface antigen
MMMRQTLRTSHFIHSIVLHQLKFVTALMLLTAGTATAAAAEPSDQWEIHLDIYLWGATIGGHTAANHPIDVSFGDLLSDLNFGFMTTLGAHKGKFSLLADIIYLDLSKEKQASGKFLGEPIDGRAKLKLTGWVSTLGGGYTVSQTEQNTLDIILGARYLNLDLDLSFRLDDRDRSFDLGATVWDGIVGLRGKTTLTEKWYLIYYGDVGTGDTELTWQTEVGFGYKFNKLDAYFGYRYLDWNFSDSDTGGNALNDLNFHGPFAGVRFVF